MSVEAAVPVRRGLFIVAVAAAAWGTGGAVATVLYRTSGLGPVAVSFWRCVFGVLVLGAVSAARWRPAGSATVLRRPVAGPGTLRRPGEGWWRPNAGWWRPGGGFAGVGWVHAGVTGVGMAVSQTAYFGAVAQSGVAIGTVVTLGAGPVLVAVGARLLLGEALTGARVVAVGVALVGLVLLLGGAGSSGPRPALGIGLALVSAAGFSAVTLFSRWGGATGDPGKMLAAFVLGAVCLLPLALVEGLLPGSAVSVGTAGWLLYLGAVPSAMAYRLYFVGLSAVPATTASVVALVEPVTAAAIGIGVLGERLTGGAVAGTVLLFGAMTLLARQKGTRQG